VGQGKAVIFVQREVNCGCNNANLLPISTIFKLLNSSVTSVVIVK
jgi:hypothetical protein